MKASRRPVKLARTSLEGPMLPAPLPLGPFLVDETGKLRFRLPGITPAFTFAWRGRRFGAMLEDGHVTLTCTVARVPSTASGADRREEAFAALRALPAIIPALWKLRLLPDHRVQIVSRQPMEWPASAPGLMQPLVTFLLALAPYFDLLEETGLVPEPVLSQGHSIAGQAGLNGPRW